MNKVVEKEAKFEVKDVTSTLFNLRKIANVGGTKYIRDVIYGAGKEGRKIRLRIEDDFFVQSFEVFYKNRTTSEDGIKTEIEEIIYKGLDMGEAKRAILRQGDFKEENSYEKIRVIYQNKKGEITLDVYPYGVWLEIEAEPDNIWELAEELGYKKEDAITLNADELYLEWNKKFGLKEFWDVRFGLTGEK